MSQRLFFALWPDDDLRERIATTTLLRLAGAGGRPQRPDQWHVTLVFIGQVAANRVDAVLRSAAGIRRVPFVVSFETIEFWRKPHVVCMTASTTPAPCIGLVGDLRAALMQEGFEVEDREFRPHVTLARKVSSWPPSTRVDPVVWPAQRFALVQSVTGSGGSRYEPLRWWNAVRRRS